jgi:osmotically-inducible protein OsmY
MVDSPSERRCVLRGVALLKRRGQTMFGGNSATDKALQKLVNRRLERSGAGTQSGLTALVQNGSVTLSGKLHLESQRMAIVKAMRGVAGVRNVSDQLQGPPKRKHS